MSVEFPLEIRLQQVQDFGQRRDVVLIELGRLVGVYVQGGEGAAAGDHRHRPRHARQQPVQLICRELLGVVEDQQGAFIAQGGRVAFSCEDTVATCGNLWYPLPG